MSLDEFLMDVYSLAAAGEHRATTRKIIEFSTDVAIKKQLALIYDLLCSVDLTLLTSYEMVSIALAVKPYLGHSPEYSDYLHKVEQALIDSNMETDAVESLLRPLKP